jgi:hypothetical protein
VTGRQRRARRQRKVELRAKTTATPEQDLAWSGKYTALTDRIVAARFAVAGDPRHPESSTEQQAAHHLLTSLLGDAVALAFAADAASASRPHGVTSWTAEGLDRSTERELAIFAALDAG